MSLQSEIFPVALLTGAVYTSRGEAKSDRRNAGYVGSGRHALDNSTGRGYSARVLRRLSELAQSSISGQF